MKQELRTTGKRKKDITNLHPKIVANRWSFIEKGKSLLFRLIIYRDESYFFLLTDELKGTEGGREKEWEEGCRTSRRSNQWVCKHLDGSGKKVDWWRGKAEWKHGKMSGGYWLSKCKGKVGSQASHGNCTHWQKHEGLRSMLLMNLFPWNENPMGWRYSKKNKWTECVKDIQADTTDRMDRKRERWIDR